MLLFTQNLKYLLDSRNVSQQALGEYVGMAHTAISNYKLGKNFPEVRVLLKICQYFGIEPNDILLKDLSSGENPSQIEKVALPINIQGANILVPQAAQAKYSSEWTQEYIQSLSYVVVPGIEGDARTFEVSSNDMNPILTLGDFAICTTSSVAQIQSGKIYAIVSPQKIHWGYVQVQKGRLHCTPANIDEYKAYYIPKAEVREVWEVQRRLTAHLVEPVLGVEARLRTVEDWLKSKFSDVVLK